MYIDVLEKCATFLDHPVDVLTEVEPSVSEFTVHISLHRCLLVSLDFLCTNRYFLFVVYMVFSNGLYTVYSIQVGV